MKKFIVAQLDFKTIACLSMSVVTVSGCASLHGRDRILSAAGIGATAGAVGGAALSPDDQNRSLNALVFGLSGAVVGGVLAALTDQTQVSSKEIQSLKAKELGIEPGGREFVIPASGTLPEFVQKRLKLPVIEEYDEVDSITEDGSLSAPHKVYRIKRPAELIARPLESGVKLDERSQ